MTDFGDLGRGTGECELCGGMYWFHTRCRVGLFPCDGKQLGKPFYAPALTSSRGAANAWLRLRSFDSPALVFSTDQNLFGRRAAASWTGGAPVRMKGVMREAVLSDVRQVGHIVH